MQGVCPLFATFRQIWNSSKIKIFKKVQGHLHKNHMAKAFTLQIRTPKFTAATCPPRVLFCYFVRLGE